MGDLIPLIFPWGRSYFMIPNILYGKQHCQCKIFRILLNGVSGVKASGILTVWPTWRLSPLPFAIIQTPVVCQLFL